MVLKMPRLKLQTIYGPFTEGLDSMTLVGPFQLRIFCGSVLVCNKVSPFSFQILTILMKLSPCIRNGMFVKTAKWLMESLVFNCRQSVASAIRLIFSLDKVFDSQNFSHRLNTASLFHTFC